MKYIQPSLEPVQTNSETQEKGQLVIQTVPAPITPTRTGVRSCRRTGGGNFLANVIDSKNEPKAEYEVRVTPAFALRENIVFQINITNRTSQVLKLESTVLRLNIDDREVPVSRCVGGASIVAGEGSIGTCDEGAQASGDKKAFLEGVLTPGERKSFSVVTPSWRGFPQNATLLFGIYGIPTEIDAAGSVSKRENFEWAFKFTSQEKSEDVQVMVSTEHMSSSQARACESSLGLK